MTSFKKSPTLWIFLLAVVARMGYLFFLADQYPFFNHPADDVLYHRQWAESIVYGHGVSSTWFGLPLFPYFLSIIVKAFHGQWNVVYLFYLIFTSFNSVLVFTIAKRVWNFPVAVVAAILCAINTHLIYYDVMLSPVGLIIFLSLFVIHRLIRFRDHFLASYWIIPGFVLGLLSMGDGKIGLLMGLVILTIIFRDRQRLGQSLLSKIIPLVCAFGLCLILAGWRNYNAGGSWVWISGQTGLSFYVGNNPQADGYYHNPDFIRPTHQGQDEDQKIVARRLSGNPNLNDKQVSQFWMKEGVRYLTTYPKEAVKLWFNKFLIFWTNTEKAFDLDLILQKPWLKTWDLNPWSLMLAFSFIGLTVGCLRRERIEFISSIILAQLIFTIIFFLTERHRATILPFLIMFESAGMVFLVEQNLKKCWDCVIGCLLLVVIFVVVTPRYSVSATFRDYLWATKQAALYNSVKDYNRTIVAYHKALTYFPQDVNALYNLGNAYFNVKMFDEAKQKYLEVLRLNPFHVDALYNLGFTFESLDDFDNAEKTYIHLIEVSGESDDVLFRLGMLTARSGRCVEAKEYVSKIKTSGQLDPQFLSPIVQSCP